MEVQEAIRKLRSVRDDVGQSISLYPYHSFNNVYIIEQFLSKQGTDFKSFIAGKRVLDVGCGDGDMAFICEMLGARTVMAVDLPDTNYNKMRGVYAMQEALGSSVQIFAGSIEQMDLTFLGPQDVILLLGILYHLPNPQYVLRKLSALGHAMIATTKVFDVLPGDHAAATLTERQVAYLLNPQECNNDNTNWWVLTEAALRLLIQRSGWRIAQTKRLDQVVGSADPARPEADGRLILLAHSVYV